MLGSAYYYFWVGSRGAKVIREVDSAGIYLTGQLRTADFKQISAIHIATVVDLRPDGEALDETPSSEMNKLCNSHGIAFAYIPVPHGDIPPGQVDRLAAVLRDGKKPLLLYCRTGKRAIRTYCLAEASRTAGRSEPELSTIAKSAGFSIEDLHTEIARRISARRNNGL